MLDDIMVVLIDWAITDFRVKGKPSEEVIKAVKRLNKELRLDVRHDALKGRWVEAEG